MIECGCSVLNDFRWQQLAAAFITPETFTRFTAGNFQVLWQFHSKSSPVTFFNVRTNRIEAAHLLIGQFTPPKIFGKNIGVRPKLIKEFASQFVNSE